MAKKSKEAGPKEAELRKLREAAADTAEGDGQEEFNFDLAAIEAEAAKAAQDVRERHLAPARERLEALKAQRETIDAEIGRLNAMLNPGAPRRGRGAASGEGGGSRMKRDEKARYVSEAAALIAGSKDGVSRSQVAERLGIGTGAAATVLKAVIADGKARKVGEKSQSRYYPPE